MKVRDLVSALSEVPGMLRESATAIRQASEVNRELEKMAALRKVRGSFVSDEEDEEDVLSALSGVDLEKLASAVAPRKPLGYVSRDDDDDSRVINGASDETFLHRMREF